MTHQAPQVMRRFLVAVFLLAATAVRAQDGAHEHPAPSSAELPDRPVRVPVDTSTKHIVVEASIDGSGPFRFVLDTAASACVIDHKLAKRLKLPIIGQARVGDATETGFKSVDLTQFETVKIGDAVLHGGHAAVMDLGALFSDETDPPAGILGFNLFRDCLLTLDYPAGSIVLERGELPAADGRQVLEFELERGIPLIKTRLAGKETEIVIDCGAATGLVLAEALKGKYPLRGEPVLTRVAKRMNTQYDVREARIAGDLEFGRARVAEPIVSFDGTRSVMGYDVLRHFVVTIDARSRRIRFGREGDDAIKLPSRCMAGFVTDLRAGVGREIRQVLAGSPAEKAGLKAGDVITTVNGRPAAQIARGDWMKLLEKPGKLAIKARRGDQVVDASVAVVVAIE